MNDFLQTHKGNDYIRFMEPSKTFYVLKSSAGSGKTYALVKFYLLLALEKGETEAYKRILAITFTNAAAAEMKERIILRLREFSELTETELSNHSLFCEIQEELRLEPHELKKRASQTLTHMLHHYGAIAVSTIDSFVHKIVRSFARDLQLSPDFNIDLDTSAFYQKVADEFLSKIGRDPEITQYIQSYAIEMLEDQSNTNIRKSVEEISTELSKEETLPILQKISAYTLSDYQKTREILKERIITFENALTEKAEKIMQLIHSRGLTVDDFSNKKKGILGGIFKILKQDFKGAQESKRLFKREEPWFTKANVPKYDPIFSPIKDQVENLRTEIIDQFEGEQYKKYKNAKSVISKIIFIGLLQKLHLIAEQIKQEENTLLIADFHRIISDLVADSPAPFIYERVGERYEHILFDEFQDTSALQWNNFLPLLENNLSKGKINLIVGDGKQAIYRWRNGKAEQFVNLPEIDAYHRPELRRALKDSYTMKSLSRNFRSASAIIDFNNKLYNFISASVADEFIQAVYQDQAQEKVRTEMGYVAMEFFNKNKEQKDDSIEVENRINGRIVEIIRECLSDGYAPGDIAILTRRGIKDTAPITEILFKNNIEFVTKESFLISNSIRVKLLMSLLHYMNDSSHKYSGVNIWECLSALHPEQYSLQALFLKYQNKEGEKTVIDVAAFLEENFPEYFNLSISSSVLQLAEQMLRIFSIAKDEYVEFLLDHLTRLSQQKDYGLGEAIEWWEEHREKLYIASQSDTEKVTLMTIHKSKGLQFPVVIYPRPGSSSPGSTIWIDKPESDLPVSVTMMPVNGQIQPHDLPEVAEEKRKMLLDDLNALYVATTRPESRLYMLVKEVQSSDVIGQSLLAFSRELQSQTSEIFFLGEKEKVAREKRNAAPRLQLSESFNRSIKQLTLRTTATNQRLEASQWKRMHGNIIHECLAFIRVAADIPHAVAKVLPKYPGWSDPSSKEIAAELLRICEHPQLRPWFDQEYEILQEQEIVAKGGEPLRPDRVVLRDHHWEVVDFKTGERHPSHERQLKRYMSELEKISSKKIRGFLIYTGDCEVIEVQ